MKEEIIAKENSEKIIFPLIAVWINLILSIIALKDYAIQMDNSFIIFSIIRIVLYFINAVLMTRGFETKKFCYYLISLLLSISLSLSIIIFFIYLSLKDSKILDENGNVIYFIVIVLLESALTFVILLYLFKAKKVFIYKKKKHWSE